MNTLVVTRTDLRDAHGHGNQHCCHSIIIMQAIAFDNSYAGYRVSSISATMSQVNRGGFLGWLSYYPHEREILVRRCMHAMAFGATMTMQ